MAANVGAIAGRTVCLRRRDDVGARALRQSGSSSFSRRVSAPQDVALSR
jgi:hypothetical protein